MTLLSVPCLPAKPLCGTWALGSLEGKAGFCQIHWALIKHGLPLDLLVLQSKARRKQLLPHRQ